VYDGNCKLCRRTIASLRALDVLGRVRYAALGDELVLAAPELRRVGREALTRDIYAFKAGKVWAGFGAYRALAARARPVARAPVPVSVARAARRREHLQAGGRPPRLRNQT
jgi:predicted DCC family thiol-disulfide oxidoreductase YuxK